MQYVGTSKVYTRLVSKHTSLSCAFLPCHAKTMKNRIHQFSKEFMIATYDSQYLGCAFDNSPSALNGVSVTFKRLIRKT